jgi:hypothetical protein
MGVKLGVALRKEPKRRMFKSRMLRRIFGRNMDEVMGG